MEEALIQRVYETIDRIYRASDGTPVKMRQIMIHGIHFRGSRVTSADIRATIDVLTERGAVSAQARFREKSLDYVPVKWISAAGEFSPAEMALKIIRAELRNVQYFDHDATDEEIISMLRNSFRDMVAWNLKARVLTRDGAIARQMIERLHFEFFVLRPGLPVRVAYLLEEDPEAIMPSTLAIRKRMLADLAAKGFLRIEKNKAIPITPYPAWSVYARNKQ